MISVPIAQWVPAGASRTLSMMNSVEPVRSAARTTSNGHSGWTSTRTAGSAARTSSTWVFVNLVCTEQNPRHSTRRVAASCARGFAASRSSARQSHSAIASSGTPIAKAVLRPRCWSGKKNTRGFLSHAHSSTARAFEEVHTSPPRAPQKALSAAVEFM